MRKKAREDKRKNTFRLPPRSCCGRCDLPSISRCSSFADPSRRGTSARWCPPMRCGWGVNTLTTSCFRIIAHGASRSWSTWCGWGTLWLMVAQPTIHFRIFGRGAAFWGIKSTPLSFSLSCGRPGRLAGPGAASVALPRYFYLSAHRSGHSAHVVDGMVLCRLLAHHCLVVSFVSSWFFCFNILFAITLHAACTDYGSSLPFS